MKSRIFVLILVPLLMGCAAFKQLEPEPEVLPVEGPYIELKDDDEFFELDKGKQYFIEFPAPREDNFYLVITISDKDNVVTGLSDLFDKNDGILSRVPNEAAADVQESVYSLKRSVQNFYWVIEKVYRDMNLEMTYRYMPKWRYKFETQYESFQNILAENRVDRTTYENIGGSVSLRNFNFNRTIEELNSKTSNLEGLFSQLASIEQLFPPSILNSTDEAYRNYISLKEDIEIEITFQKNYKKALELFQLELKSRDDMRLFVSSIPEFLNFYKEKERYPSNIIQEANRTFDARLGELTPYFEDNIRTKNDAKPFDVNIDDVNNLYNEIGSQKPEAYKNLAAFIKDYNSRAHAINDVKTGMDDLKNQIASLKQWPSNGFFQNLSADLNRYTQQLPKAGFSSHGQFASAKCVDLLNKEIYAARSISIRSREEYKKAQGLVAQLNRYAANNSYRQMIQLINRNKDVSFLADVYKNLDSKSLNQQKARINNALKTQNWKSAENGLRTLHYDSDFINAGSIRYEKGRTVKALEDTLLARVERVTRQNVNAFVNEKYKEVNNVEGLYQDPVFRPAWDITFSSGSQNDLALRKQKLNERLTALKENEFPKKAIQFMYKDFSADINNNGVLKARAIVTHGQHYKGGDMQIKRLVAECDPWASKWITKTVNYRKMYALPITTNKTGENTYVFRVNFRIPTEARFPAYDVNIKLPKAVANNAGSTSWYSEMTMNKNPLKPEGRFTITAPNASNDYTALLAPLQVTRDDNVLEVRFKHNSFKVFEVSINAQKPILRKN